MNEIKVPVRASTSNIIAPVKAKTSSIVKKVHPNTAINVIHEDTEIYEGEYVVTPKFYEETILETQDKKMEENVQVLEIPYYETRNPSGSYTIYIGIGEE